MRLVVVPERVDEAQPSGRAFVDWELLLHEAGLDLAQFKPATPS